MVRRFALTAAAIILLPVSNLLAQAADSGLAAGSRVARAIIDPFPVMFGRGDSLSVRVALVDSVGGEVSGARWSLETDGGPVRMRIADSSADARQFVFAGDAPGAQAFWVAVQRPGAGGRVDTARVDSLTATVSDWSIARLEIVAPEYDAYSGTTMQLRVKAYSANNEVVEDPKVTWETDDPCHARVLPDGAVTFGSSSKITVTAKAQGKEAKREIRISSNPVQTIDISPKSARTRTGDVVKFRVGASDSRGVDVTKVALAYSVSPLDSSRGSARIDDRGYFVAEEAGNYLVRVSAGDINAEALVEVGRRPAPNPVRMVGRGPLKNVRTRGLAVFSGKDGHDYAYTGSEHGRVYVWDVSDPARVVLSDSVVLDAAVAGDIKVGPDGSWAVVARSGGVGARNGITILDLATPAHPRVMGSLTDNLVGGVKTVWIHHSWVYAVNEQVGALDIVDLSQPAQPRYVGRWETRPGQIKKLNDVWGDQKNLYLAHGADGLVILDIVDDGTPSNPKLVSQFVWKRAAASSVVRAGRYAYVGEEILDCAECVNGPRGAVQIIDLTKIKEPAHVAKYEVPEAGVDRLTVESSMLFAGYRQGGVRLVDVTGEMRGDVYREGRQVGWFMTSTPEIPAMASAVASFKGLVFVADANSGLWVLRHQRAARLTP